MPKPIKAKKSLGQNFLIDVEALSDIAHSIEVKGKHIIEVGPGYGALTDYLIAEDPLSLDLVELDRDIVDILNQRMMKSEWWRVNAQTNPETGVKQFSINHLPLTIYHQDILTFLPPHQEYSVIANIPYYITSPILFHFLYPQITRWWKQWNGGSGGETVWAKKKSVNRWVDREGASFSPSETFGTFGHESTETVTHKSPQEMIIMMQQEVWEKILEWRARKPHHSYLSLAMELACEDIEIVRYVGKESFDPAPKVDSIVLKFTVKASRNREREEEILALWRTAFTHPRKTLLSNLKWSHYAMEQMKKWLVECGYDEKVRAEAVRKEDWGKFL